jgi:hypothetical protein
MVSCSMEHTWEFALLKRVFERVADWRVLQVT